MRKAQSTLRRSPAVLLALLVVITSTLIPALTPQASNAAPSAPAAFYVSRNGNNSNGLSWATAWRDLDQINWSVVQPGATIYLDGGSTEMVYTSTLAPTKDGAPDNPITIALSSEAGRNGKAVIFGGRSTPLPYCGQSSYDVPKNGARTNAMVLENRSWIKIDGTKWRGITIYGHNGAAIDLNSRSANIVVRNIEMYDNGAFSNDGGWNKVGGWAPHGPAIQLSGANLTFERLIAYDNGVDAFQSGGGVRNLTVRQSWFYNTRKDPSGKDFNRCQHQDGIQIYDGGDQYGVLIEDTIFGPGLLHGLILGEPPEDSGSNPPEAYIHNVTIRNSLFYEADNASIFSHKTPRSTNWVVDHVTSVRKPDAKWHNIGFYGTGLQVTNSVIVGGMAMLTGSKPTFANNCQWQINANIGTVADPKFVDPAKYNYALQSNSPCAGKGSRITSAAQLLGQENVPPPAEPKPPVPPKPADVPWSFYMPLLLGTAPARITSAPLVWEAESGKISQPFAVQEGAVSQARETKDPALGGRATYRFTVEQDGNYRVKAVVNAPTVGSNSVFINIDGTPVNPTMIWDVTPTQGFEERTVSWRGAGTDVRNEFTPMIFNLKAGEHEMVIVGREARMQIDRIMLEAITMQATTVTLPTESPSQSFEAESGTFTKPMESHGEYIVQPTETKDATKGGRATYRFNIATPGDYRIKMTVDAPDAGSNSAFVNIDGDPVGPKMIWDILTTDGFEERTVAWRGDGNEDIDDLAHAIFRLEAGEHELVIVGREQNVKIDRIRIEAVPADEVPATPPPFNPPAEPAPTAEPAPAAEPTPAP